MHVVELSWLPRLCVVTLLFLLPAAAARADGPRDNDPDRVRRIPKLGIEVTEEQRRQLESGLAELEKQIQTLRASSKETVARLLPDVLIFHRAVDVALEHQEFFAAGDVKAALELLATGSERADQLARGEAAWPRRRGLVVRGYVSRLDKTVQPYGLVIPPSYDPTRPMRLDVWFHGRGETLSEVKFLQQRRRQAGVFTPPNTIVLHPYGRYSNANKFAGEIDVLEAIEDVQRRYAVDRERIAVRGFSMGGASTWQLAVHYPTRWVAANPGAGFSETPQFLRSFQGETLRPTWWEKKLWHWYNCDDWAVNLSQCPTVAYSGEIDRQKQAADVMAAAMEREGLRLVHEIGPKTGHRYHPQTRDRVDAKIAQIAKLGRRRTPRTIHFVTYTLRYNRCAWVTVDALQEHWTRARVDGTLDVRGIALETANVDGVTLSLPPGTAPFDGTKPVRLMIDGQAIDGGPVRSDRSWSVSLIRIDDAWRVRTAENRPAGLRKRHLLQGPIDDALMDAFLFVSPTGQTDQTTAAKWSQSELERAVEHWRRHFRGDARVKADTEISDEDIAANNLVLWGDPSSNAVLKRIADQLPVRWTDQAIQVGDASFDADHHALIMIYPNPLNPRRYVVLNSSFTFRDYAYLNNARQTPMLPDWAVVDLREPPGSQWPGRIADAGFFDEQWQWKPGPAQ